jgi:hypothetical protein
LGSLREVQSERLTPEDAEREAAGLVGVREFFELDEVCGGGDQTGETGGAVGILGGDFQEEVVMRIELLPFPKGLFFGGVDEKERRLGLGGRGRGSDFLGSLFLAVTALGHGVSCLEREKYSREAREGREGLAVDRGELGVNSSTKTGERKRNRALVAGSVSVSFF